MELEVHLHWMSTLAELGDMPASLKIPSQDEAIVSSGVKCSFSGERSVTGISLMEHCF